MSYMKILKIIGPILILLALVGYIKRLDALRDGWRQAAVAIADEAQASSGLNPPAEPRKDGKPPPLAEERAGVVRKRGLAAVGTLAAQRDEYLRQRNDNKRALLDQTARVLDLAAETQRLRAQAAEQLELVKRLKKERAALISKAERAANRTERRSCEEEIQEMEEALDALYHAGF